MSAGHQSSQSMLLRKDGSMSAVALGVCHGSLTHRGWRYGGHSVVMLCRQSFLCANPASPLSQCSTARVFQPVAAALLRPCQAPRSCRVTLATSAVVPATLPAEGRVAPVAGQPTPLLIGVRRSGLSVSWQGGVPPCQGHWLRLAVASCWRRGSQQRDHVPP